MKNSTKLICAFLMVAGVFTANAQDASEQKTADNLLWIVGGSLPEGWSPGDATALVPSPDNSKVYSGTVYLNPENNPTDSGFKFLTNPWWGSLEYRALNGETLQDGKIKIANSDDNPDDSKIFVPDAGNYHITVDLENMEATVVKSDYQETPIKDCSLFVVGTPTKGGYDIDNGTPMYQDVSEPYIYTAALTVNNPSDENGGNGLPGDFKITRAITKDGSTCWNGKYWYFADYADSNKMVLDQEGDNKWSIPEPGDYTIIANTKDNTLQINKGIIAGVVSIDDKLQESIEYYNLSGIKVCNPNQGIFIRRQGGNVEKIVIR